MPAHRKAQAALYATAVQTEDVYGAVSEMTSRLDSGIWPTPATVDPVRLRRVIARMREIEHDLPILRGQYEAALNQKAA